MRIVAHVDMDAFYASVEERLNPALRGRPVVVGADPKGGADRGVVTRGSYAARKYGIRSALPISRAWRLAEAARRRGEPEAVFVRDNRQAYREASTRIMALIADGGDAFEGASIDEAYVDLSPLGGFDEAEAHARALKARVREREELTCSVGLGPNKLVAKIASDFQKPDGLTVVRPDDVLGFLGGLRVRVIPGIGPKTEAALGERGIATVADLRAVEPARLAEWFGKLGLELHDKSRGISDDPVSNEWERKSVGEQETFEEDSLDPGFVLGRARALAAEVFRRVMGDLNTGETARVLGAFRDHGFVDLFRAANPGAPGLTVWQRIEAPSPTVFRRVDYVREGRRWPRGDRGVGARRAEHPGDARRRRCLVALGPLRRLRRGDAQAGFSAVTFDDGPRSRSPIAPPRRRRSVPRYNQAPTPSHPRG